MRQADELGSNFTFEAGKDSDARQPEKKQHERANHAAIWMCISVIKGTKVKTKLKKALSDFITPGFT